MSKAVLSPLWKTISSPVGMHPRIMRATRQEAHENEALFIIVPEEAPPVFNSSRAKLVCLYTKTIGSMEASHLVLYSTAPIN